MTITLEQVRETLKQVVADFGPDTKYSTRFEEITGRPYDNETCSYQIGGTPACIVGVVLDRLGVTLDPDRDESLYEGAIPVSFLDVDMNYLARNYLQEAQDKQDQEFTWGYALEAAEESLR